jgi:hypothetical protein
MTRKQIKINTQTQNKFNVGQNINIQKFLKKNKSNTERMNTKNTTLNPENPANCPNPE